MVERCEQVLGVVLVLLAVGAGVRRDGDRLRDGVVAVAGEADELVLGRGAEVEGVEVELEGDDAGALVADRGGRVEEGRGRLDDREVFQGT